jgi:hypothetical protein
MYWKKEGQAELCQGDEFPMTKEKASYSFCLFFYLPSTFHAIETERTRAWSSFFSNTYHFGVINPPETRLGERGKGKKGNKEKSEQEERETRSWQQLHS